eukprot:maker-scaffold_29-snap-gene-3.29-mRNA-1 protein AED:0.07 eAED:0.07 QI:82/0.5/0.33/1/0/0/3/0/390
MNEIPYILRSSSSFVEPVEQSKDVYLFNYLYKLENVEQGRKSENLKLLQQRFYRLVWFTYRKNFFPLTPNGNRVTSDAGWGCMLRTAQMLLAETLQRHLGEAFGYKRIDDALKSIPEDKNKHNNILYKNNSAVSIENKDHSKLVQWFVDAPKVFSTFGIHRMCQIGAQYGLEVGQWYGPNTVCQVARDLLNENGIITESTETKKNLSVYFSSDGAVYFEEIQTLSKDWKNSILILLPVRLGLDKVNEGYRKCIAGLMKLESSVGIIGGKPRSSLYFVGEEKLIYLDPHTVQSTIEVNFSSGQSGAIDLTENDLETYHCKQMRTLSFDDLDPSMAFGFYVDLESRFTNFVSAVTVLQETKDVEKIITFSKTRPTFSELEVEGEEEDDFALV